MTDVIGPLDGVLPSEAYYDVLISDIHPDDLPGLISDVMGVRSLSVPADPTPVWPCVGKVWGVKRRCLFTLPVSLGPTAVSAHFLLDTGAPTSFLALSTVSALSLQAYQLSEKPVKLNGVRHPFRISDEEGFTDARGVWNECRFKGLNLLGMDYLDRINGVFTVDMASQTASIDRGGA